MFRSSLLCSKAQVVDNCRFGGPGTVGKNSNNLQHSVIGANSHVWLCYVNLGFGALCNQERGTDLEKAICHCKVYWHLSTWTRINHWIQLRSLLWNMIQQVLYLSVTVIFIFQHMAGCICVDVSNSLVLHSWISALYLNITSFTMSVSEFWNVAPCGPRGHAPARQLSLEPLKRDEGNVRPTCGPAKIILQQKDVWNYKYFPLQRTGSQCRGEGAQGPCFWWPSMTYYDAASSRMSRCCLR